MNKQTIIANSAIEQVDRLNRMKAIGADEYELIKHLLNKYKEEVKCQKE